MGLLVGKTCGGALEWPKGLPFVVFVTVIAGPRRRRDNQIEMAVGLKIKQCQIRAAEISLDGKLKRGALRVAAVTFRTPIDRGGGIALQESRQSVAVEIDQLESRRIEITGGRLLPSRIHLPGRLIGDRPTLIGSLNGHGAEWALRQGDAGQRELVAQRDGQDGLIQLRNEA